MRDRAGNGAGDFKWKTRTRSNRDGYRILGKEKRDRCYRFIPYGWLRTGRRLHRSGSQHTCPCRLLPCHSPWRLRMQDTRSRRFHTRCIYRYQRLLPMRSLHGNGFGRADVYTGLAVNAHVLVDFCLIILEGDCGCRTLAHAGFTSGTFMIVNDCYQLVHSIRYISFIGKKRVTIVSCFCRGSGGKSE
jgi:hypothetical protein